MSDFYYFICTKCKKYGGLINKESNYVDIIRSKDFLLQHHDCWFNPSDLIDLHKRNCCIVREDYISDDYINEEKTKFGVENLHTFKQQIEEDIRKESKDEVLPSKINYS